MDEDIEKMSREQLIAEAKSCAPESARTVIVAATSSVGITQHSGASCPRGLIRYQQFPPGRSSSARLSAVSPVARRTASGRPARGRAVPTVAARGTASTLSLSRLGA